MAKRTRDGGILTLHSILVDAETLEAVALYKNSKFFEASQRNYQGDLGKQHTPATPGPPTKKAKIDRLKIKGPIIVMTKYLQDPYTWPPGETPLCAGTLRDDCQGCGKRDECKFSHTHISQ